MNLKTITAIKFTSPSPPAALMEDSRHPKKEKSRRSERYTASNDENDWFVIDDVHSGDHFHPFDTGPEILRDIESVKSCCPDAFALTREGDGVHLNVGDTSLEDGPHNIVVRSRTFIPFGFLDVDDVDPPRS